MNKQVKAEVDKQIWLTHGRQLLLILCEIWIQVETIIQRSSIWKNQNQIMEIASQRQLHYLSISLNRRKQKQMIKQIIDARFCIHYNYKAHIQSNRNNLLLNMSKFFPVIDPQINSIETAHNGDPIFLTDNCSSRCDCCCVTKWCWCDRRLWPNNST